MTADDIEDLIASDREIVLSKGAYPIATTAVKADNALATTLVNPDDPAWLGFSPMLPFELAMKSAPVNVICEAYGVTFQQFKALTADPMFQQAYQAAKELLQKEGMSFRVKARIQAEELLKKAYALIQAPETPTPVKADLIKAVVRWAGYEPKNTEAGAVGNAFQININLGDRP
jgi:hypothetical protein